MRAEYSSLVLAGIFSIHKPHHIRDSAGSTRHVGCWKFASRGRKPGDAPFASARWSHFLWVGRCVRPLWDWRWHLLVFDCGIWDSRPPPFLFSASASASASLSSVFRPPASFGQSPPLTPSLVAQYLYYRLPLPLVGSINPVLFAGIRNHKFTASASHLLLVQLVASYRTPFPCLYL